MAAPPPGLLGSGTLRIFWESRGGREPMAKTKGILSLGQLLSEEYLFG